MQLKPPSGRRAVTRALLFTVLAGALVSASPASADQASGTWTGHVSAVGNYYWERSTRVIAPRFGLELVSPEGTRVDAHYLVDSITSASQATGALTDARFNEIRHEFGLGIGRELDLGKAQLDLNVMARLSREPDYLSTGGGLLATLSLNERSTLLHLGLTYLHDDVDKKLRGATRIDPTTGRDLSDRGQVGQLDGWVLSVGWSQVLSPVLLAEVGYDLGYLTGFLANPYRTVPVSGMAQPENHPTERIRHTAYGRLAWYLPATGTALHLMYKAYLDSWDIAALTPEVRVYQDVGPFTTLRLRYRYYTQTRAFFYKPINEYSAEDMYITADPKMSAFHTELLGLQLSLDMGFLDSTALEALHRATWDMSFEYIWNTNSYGNGVIAQMGLRVPF